jgi:hypothetical protein
MNNLRAEQQLEATHSASEALIDELHAKLDAVGEYASYYNETQWQASITGDQLMTFDEWWAAQEHEKTVCYHCGKESFFVMLTCDICHKPMCDACLVQYQDGRFCPLCFVVVRP